MGRRLKPIKPVDRKFERDKKRDRLRSGVTYAFAVLWLTSIMVMGTNQHNGTVVGAGLLIMGAVSAAYAVFLYYVTFRLRWTVRSLWEDGSVRERAHLNKELFKKERERNETGLLAASAIFLFLGIGCLALGLLRLVGKA